MLQLMEGKQKRCSDPKILLAKSVLALAVSLALKAVWHCRRSDVAGGLALHAVSECNWRHYNVIRIIPPSHLPPELFTFCKYICSEQRCEDSQQIVCHHHLYHHIQSLSLSSHGFKCSSPYYFYFSFRNVGHWQYFYQFFHI